MGVKKRRQYTRSKLFKESGLSTRQPYQLKELAVEGVVTVVSRRACSRNLRLGSPAPELGRRTGPTAGLTTFN